MALNSSGSIFEEPLRPADRPLAAELRPRSLAEIIGHDEYLGPDGLLGAMAASKRIGSLLLFGPPGVGKTTIARVLASQAGYRFAPLVATSVGVKEIKEASIVAGKAFEVQGVKTVVFIDELHRLTKVQSDALLLPVEEGTFTLIGATTENPWMQVGPALLSRLLVVELSVLGWLEVSEVLARAMGKTDSVLEEGAGELIFELCGGDLRSVINTFDGALSVALTRSKGARAVIGLTDVRSARKRVSSGLSRSDHFEMTSALIKSMRSSDANAALYWLARLLVAGEDPRFIARRLLIFASEDIGLADSNALVVAHATIHATDRIGMPEVKINLGHCVSYMSLARKSRASYEAVNKALQVAERTMGWPVPEHLRGTVTEIEANRGRVPESGVPFSRFPSGLGEVEFLKFENS